MKTLLKLLLLVGVGIYLVFTFTRIAGWSDTTKCTVLNVIIADSAHAGFITADEVKRLLVKSGQNPIGQEMDKINGEKIEETLLRNSFIKQAKCYKTPGGSVNVQIAQRLPILRIKDNKGNDYYIDNNGRIMQSQNYSADLPVATGEVGKAQLKNILLPLAQYAHDNAFANDLILQVNVSKSGEAELVPRFGCDIIRLGRTDKTNIARQLSYLQTFYRKVLPTVGWNTYKEINLEYTNQIVCKRF